jgi:hypothetical protein
MDDKAQIMAWLLDGSTGILKFVIVDSLLRQFSPMNEQALILLPWHVASLTHNKNLMPDQNGNKIDVHVHEWKKEEIVLLVGRPRRNLRRKSGCSIGCCSSF